MARLSFLLLLILAALTAIAVTALNPASVPIELAFARLAAPLGVALVVAFTVGLLIGMAWRIRWISSLLGERSRLRRALRLAESRARAQAIER